MPAGRLHEHADDRARQDELNVSAEAASAMPAAPAVEELATVRTQTRNDVLEVGRGGRGGPERSRVERPAAKREQSQTEQAAPDFEATIADVLVRHPVTGEVERRAQGQRRQPGAGQRTQRPTRRDME
jgi:hypothetical protein